jgi:hypothetical protein
MIWWDLIPIFLISLFTIEHNYGKWPM